MNFNHLIPEIQGQRKLVNLLRSGLLFEMLHLESRFKGRSFRKQRCLEDFSDGEHHQHMEVNRIRILEGKQQ